MKQLPQLYTLQSQVFTRLVLAFPFLVMFSPRLDLMFTHARVDELLLLVCIPFAVNHYLHSSSRYARLCNASYFRALSVLFVLFVVGLLYGDGAARWSQPNLKIVLRPIIVILNILFVRYLIYKSNAKSPHLIVALISAVALAGALGYMAMFSPNLADALKDLYYQEIPLFDAQGFDMASRAMSVFNGYDQASVTYAMGCMLSLFLFSISKTTFWKGFSIIVTICLLTAIVSSARIGFVSLLFGVLSFMILNMKGKSRMLASVCAILGMISILLVPFIQSFFPKNETIERFMDVVSLFDFSSPLPFWERSYGVSVLLQSQVLSVQYPQGNEVVFGFGDNGEFVSDVGYITVFVKYGIVGIATLFFTLFTIGRRGFQIGRKAISSVTGKGGFFPISAILPGLTTLFIVASMKGGLYFVTYKTGELFAYILALCIVEGEIVFANTGFHGGKVPQRFLMKNLM